LGIKVFLNLISVRTGGQIIRARRFISLVSANYPHIELHVVKLHGVLDDIIVENNIKIYNIYLGKSFLLVKRLMWENFSMQKLINKTGASVFLSFSHYLPYKTLPIPTILGISNLAPFVTLESEDESFKYRLKFKILKKTIINSLRKADLILALSLTAKKKLLELNFDENKILYCPIGVDSDWGNRDLDFSVLNHYNIKKKYFLYVSHFYGYKNHKRLINAYNNLTDQIRSEYQLVLIGRAINEHYYSEIMDLISNTSLGNDIVVIDGLEKDPLKVFYQNCHLFVFPSLVENCPNIILEAMACGSPILASNLEPMTEYCLNAANYFDPRDEESIMNALIKSVDDNVFEMKQLAFNRSKLFTWEKFTMLLVESIERLPNKKTI
jgi:glycosyltransferase involved in cell wall biosynthesis